jgi:DNA uptake protein ComE-like DNA-binding protein
MKKDKYPTRLRNKILGAFDFSKAEQRGIIVLVIVLILFVLIRIAVNYIQKSHYSTEMEDADIELFIQRQQEYRDSVLLAKNGKNKFKNNNYNSKSSSNKKILNPFSFDPNTLTLSGWQKLGFTEKQAQQIINYRSKGGYFYKKTDIKKIYCITEEDYQVLENYINIASEEKQETTKKKTDLPHSYKVELNTADSLDLLKIYGIGAKTASQIIKYRNKLGGYVAVNQLKEVYVIDSNRFLQISPYLYVDLDYVQKININKAGIKELSKHPYVDDYLAKSIVQYRQKNGNYTHIADIKKAVLVYEELYLKIVPYLSVE